MESVLDGGCAGRLVFIAALADTPLLLSRSRSAPASGAGGRCVPPHDPFAAATLPGSRWAVGRRLGSPAGVTSVPADVPLAFPFTLPLTAATIVVWIIVSATASATASAARQPSSALDVQVLASGTSVTATGGSAGGAKVSGSDACSGTGSGSPVAACRPRWMPCWKPASRSRT